MHQEPDAGERIVGQLSHYRESRVDRQLDMQMNRKTNRKATSSLAKLQQHNIL